MISDIIYKVYRMEKRLKQLEKFSMPTMREDLGVLAKNEGVKFSNTVCAQSSSQALLVLAPSEVLLQGGELSATGMLCIPLRRGVNSVTINCIAQSENVRCCLIMKIIELG